MINLLTFGLLILLGAISPGPDCMLIMKNALVSSKNGILTSIGIITALLIHILFINIGLTTISSFTFNLVKIIGATYLTFIGVKTFLTKSIQLNYSPSNKNLSIITEGLLCNLLNPKAIIFLISLYSLVIKRDTAFLLKICYAGEIIFIPFLWFIILSLIINFQFVKTRIVKIQYFLLKIMGLLLISFGIKLFLTDISKVLIS